MVSRAKNVVRGRRLDEMEQIEIEGLCYLVLILTEATIQALALDESLDERYTDIPWRDIRDTGNRLRHGYASLDVQVVHEVVGRGHIDQLLAFSRKELERLGA
jgi:uncharacterized protein with HEPN domain